MSKLKDVLKPPITQVYKPGTNILMILPLQIGEHDISVQTSSGYKKIDKWAVSGVIIQVLLEGTQPNISYKILYREGTTLKQEWFPADSVTGYTLDTPKIPIGFIPNNPDELQ